VPLVAPLAAAAAGSGGTGATVVVGGVTTGALLSDLPSGMGSLEGGNPAAGEGLLSDPIDDAADSSSSVAQPAPASNVIELCPKYNDVGSICDYWCPISEQFRRIIKEKDCGKECPQFIRSNEGFYSPINGKVRPPF